VVLLLSEEKGRQWEDVKKEREGRLPIHILALPPEAGDFGVACTSLLASIYKPRYDSALGNTPHLSAGRGSG